MKEDFYISCLLVSKICHDLMGASSSLSFAMEMLEEAEQAGASSNKEALSLANQSSKVLINKLKYFRAAFGISSISGEGSTIDKAKELIFELCEEKEIYINWQERYDAILAKMANNINIKFFLNVFLVAFYAIPKSATINLIAVEVNAEEVGVMLTVKGYKVALTQEIIDIINNKKSIEDINPRNIQAYFIGFLKQETEARVEIHNNNANNELKIAFSLKKIITNRIANNSSSNGGEKIDIRD